MALFDQSFRDATPVLGPIYALVARIGEWDDDRRTRKALAKLSDHELDDIGLSRGDIHRITGYRHL